VNTEYTFRATTYDEDGDISTDVEHTFTTEDFLPDVLYHFKSFLQGAGYNYVTDVYAVKNDGNEVGEE
jgi:hypothetical protein